jgi:cyanophycinase-like exopeptidase
MWIVAALFIWSSQTRVGPPAGTIIAVGGGNRPDIFVKFIEAAGGPDKLIVYIPTAGMTPPGETQLTRSAGDSTETVMRAAGAQNLILLHTFDRTVADSEGFVEPLKRAGGVWFGGGRPERIMDVYAGTRTELEFRNVLARGGVLGGTSAGAVALGSSFVSNSMSDIPLEERSPRPGFAFLRGVAVQPHNRTGQPRSWTLNRPDLLGIAMDEVTGWLVRGDIAEIVGSGDAYVFEKDPTGAPFITLRSGDQYDMGSHAVRRRDGR